ncbi:hypothetical protein ACFFRR_009578 [Megaselia abdita]
MDYGVLTNVKSGHIYQQSRLVPQSTYNFYPLSQINSHQTKSLQELQNEVGALLEFRDLVIETFPDLKNKMVSMSNAGTNDNNLTVNASSNSLASRREWEPGVKLRRKNFNKDITNIHQSSSIHNNGLNDIISSLSRHRSDSHIGKREPKSGEGGNGSVIQDSGFSTETSSTKENHSSSSAGGVCQIMPSRVITLAPNESEDELLNLLDVIHRKSIKLRDEFEKMQSNNPIESSFSPPKCNLLQSQNISFTECSQKERDSLLEKLADVEAGRALGQIKIDKLQKQINQIKDSKRNLEGQLKKALNLSTKKIVRDLENSTPDNIDFQDNDIIEQKCFKLGNLDSILTPLHKITKVRNIDSNKISAILLETNVVELQRHLLRLCVQNQAILHSLHKTTRSKLYATRKLEKSVELIDDLRFQLEEKNIELEGSKAQLRMAESSYLHKTLNISKDEKVPSLLEPNIKISPPSMRGMHHIEITDIGIHDSSGTESTCFHPDKDNEKEISSRKNKPSKIPLPGKPITRSPTTGLSLNNSTTTIITPKLLSRGVCYASKPVSVGNSIKNDIINNSCSITYMNKSPSSYKYNTSPTLKTRRDSSQTLRGKNIDSLSSSSKSNFRPKGNIPTFRNENFQSSNSISRKHSSISLGSTKQHNEDVGKVRNIRSAFWSWLKMS